MDQKQPIRGRFAPSPSGRMHLGNLFAALLAWLDVRSLGGQMVLRMEDLDPQRCKPAYLPQLAQDLLWLGLDWDTGWQPGDTAPPHRRLPDRLSPAGGAGPGLPLLLYPEGAAGGLCPPRL